ncbi:MAG: PKD domain-containing protein [Candidatus Eisenbacteria bacterium]
MASKPALAAFRRAASYRSLAASLALVSMILASPAHAQRRMDPEGPAWSAPPGAEPCMAEDDLARRLEADAALATRRALFEQLVQEATRKKLMGATTSAGPSYVIPVAVHIVHMGGIENVSDQQVLSQLYALNRDFADSLVHGAPAVDTKISFCLAQNLPANSAVTWSTTPGITRTFSSQTNHSYGNQASEIVLKAIDYLPSDKYLNIWVVKTITGGSGGVAGYATFPGTVPASVDGIVIRADAFGSNFTPFGSGYNLMASNQDGKILTHEAGHWLNLYHTFHGGCSATGDQVADTPMEQVNHAGCPANAPTSCSATPDPIENFMDYTNDACRFAFTAGQQVRMQTALAAYRSVLVSATNLIASGCSSGLNPLLVLAPAQLCSGGTVQVSTSAQASGMTYAWSFPGGTPGTATTQNASTTYPAAGTYPVTLTVTDASNASATNTGMVYVVACAPIANRCTNWTFGLNTGLSFATGAPVAVAGRIPAAVEAATTMSDPAGNLLFYSDGDRAIDRTNAVMPNGNGITIGGSSHTGVIAIPRPGSSSQYFLFGVRMQEDSPVPNPFTYSVIDMALNGGFGDIPAGQKNLPITLPNNPTFMMEAVAAIPHCNGTDWWLLTHGGYMDTYKIYITRVTSAGPISTTVSNLGMDIPGTLFGGIRPTADGTKFAIADASTKEVAVYGFNRSTGAVSTVLAPTVIDAWSDALLSPNQQILYYLYNTNGIHGVRQLQLSTMQVRDVVANMHASAIAIGPDGKLYLSQMGQSALHTVNFPDAFNMQNLNECGYNPLSVPVGVPNGVLGSLPNQPANCGDATLAADFTTKVTNCLTVQCISMNCTGPFNWNFGDATVGSGANVTHTYAAPGTYTITLTVPAASPTVKARTLPLGLPPVTIAGSNTACALAQNYSAIGPANLSYAWSLSGGTPAFGSGNNLDVVWLPTGGQITLTVTDSTTGCSTTLTKNVGPCPVCKSPPLSMTAWWPLDEPAGTTAIETVQGNHATDIATPQHSAGMVRRARTFNGASQWLEANDAPGLNFGAGDLTIDAWVRTTQASGVRRIVDKRAPDPAVGFSLYLRDGRLALGLGAPPNSTLQEYWSPTTPFVADGQWHHVAGVLERADATSGTRLYVDGNAVASWPAFNPTGNLTNTQKLLIGAGAGFGPPVEHWSGGIDEVELFQRALSASDILALALADSLGKCKEFVYVPKVASLCRDRTEVTVTISLCNWSTAPQTYLVTLAGLATGPGCTFAGPTVFQVLGLNPVTVPANSCAPVQVVITRPPGMPLYATACYQVTATNTANSQAMIGQGAVVAARQWCDLVAVPTAGIAFAGTGTSALARFVITNTSGGPLTAPYTISAEPAPGSEGGGGGGLGDPPGVMLNGLAPDTPFAGNVTLADGASTNIDISATFAEARSFRFYDLVLRMDDGNGSADALATHGLTFREGGSPFVGVTPPAVPLPARVELGGLAPNPVTGLALVRFALPRAGDVTLTLYDIVGRRVRTLYRGVAAAGPGSVQVNCEGLPRGLYFLQLATVDGTAGRRVTVVR